MPNENQWNKATLAIEYGGIGLRKTEDHCLAAYISSITSCASNSKEILSSFNGDSLNIPTHLQLAFNSSNSKLVYSENLKARF